MPVNLAAKRGAKNHRRKLAVAQKRKAELEAGTLAARVRLALAEPLQQCLLTSGLTTYGMATLLVVRGATQYNVTVAGFLLDTVLGVKDTFLHSVNSQELTGLLDQMSVVGEPETLDPGAARELVHDFVARARCVGHLPHRDYAKLEPIFGSVAQAADAAFDFATAPVVLDLSELSLELAPLESDDGVVIDADEADVSELT